jgi:hypothetical protein
MMMERCQNGVKTWRATDPGLANSVLNCPLLMLMIQRTRTKLRGRKDGHVLLFLDPEPELSNCKYGNTKKDRQHKEITISSTCM